MGRLTLKPVFLRLPSLMTYINGYSHDYGSRFVKLHSCLALASRGDLNAARELCSWQAELIRNVRHFSHVRTTARRKLTTRLGTSQPKYFLEMSG